VWNHDGMTDDQQWQAPDAAPPVAPPAMPPAMPPAAPSVGPLAPPPAAPLGWTPPPKPGLIPLRPLTLGMILSAAFQTLRRNPGATLGPALILSAVVAVIQALGSAGFLTQYLGVVSDLGSSTGSTAGDFGPSFTSGLLGYVATTLGSGILSLIVTAIVQGIVTVQVAGSTLGTRLRLGALWARLRGRRGAVVGWAVLSGLAAILAVGIVTGLLVLLGLAGGAAILVAVLLGLLLGLVLFVGFVWLWVRLGFVPAVIVLERASIRTSMRRSWRLTRGAFWRTFGIRLLVLVMIGVATNIIVTPVSLIFSLGGTILSPNGSTDGGASQALVLSLIVTQAVTALVSAVGLVVSTATTSLLYLDQRMRLEGLDLDLSRYVERRQAGEQGLADPFLPTGPE
jgi:hypothetical protein